MCTDAHNRAALCGITDAATRAVLMTVHRTLKLRGQDPRQAIAGALAASSATGSLPPCPHPLQTAEESR